MADYKIEFNKVIYHEGGYVNDPDDSGGETYLGIARKHNPNWYGWVIIDKVKRKRPISTLNKWLAKEEELLRATKGYYKKYYWDVLYLDDIPSQKIAHVMFDTCVNMGKIAAIRVAQKILYLPQTGRWSTVLFNRLKSYVD